MKTNVSNSRLPGVTAQDTMTMGTELIRREVERNGAYIGTIVYVRRKSGAGSEYGWRPEKSHPRAKLTDQVGAIERLGR